MKINKALVILSLLSLSACSTVRDATDWVPGVASNEEIKAEQEQLAREARRKEQQAYHEKAIYEPVSGGASEADARINVDISQKFTREKLVNREDIGIEVNSGVVTLSGSVNTQDAAVKAITLAKNTPGVSRVISRLVIIQLRDNQ
jgi:osmotically-inducible protein OsmY